MIKKFFFCLFFSLLSVVSFAQEEQITITTYYPSPFGSYRELRSNRMAVADAALRPMPAQDGVLFWGANRGALLTDQGASIELGGTGTPYIDFSNDPNADFDSRIVLLDNDILGIQGVRNGALTVDGYVYARSDVGCNSPPCGCIWLTYGSSSGNIRCPDGFRMTVGAGLTDPAPAINGGIIWCCRT